MADDKQIQRWVDDGTITQAQARKMLADSSEYNKEQRSDKLIITVSTIGALLLGIGAILFIASNWRVIPDLVKVLILLTSTFGAYYLGYFFRYQKNNLPKVGFSLLFLGALLFGATIILVTQIYNINANNHILVLIWLLGILPLVYALKNQPIAALASALFFVWLGLFFGEWGPVTLVLFLVGSIALFAIGGLHYFREDFADIARIYRIAGLKVMMIVLFLLTFSWFSKTSSFRPYYTNPEQLTLGIVAFAGIATILLVINWFFNESEKVSRLEGPLGMGIIALALVFFSYPSDTSIYVLIFNLVLAGIIAVLIYLGYDREDMRLVNMGTFWLAAFIIVRYFDWFWKLLPRSLFFIAGGLILVLGGIALEKKRRQLKQEFGSNG